MTSVADKKYKMRSSIALVYHKGILEFFKTNIRESIKIRIEFEHIEEFLLSFDGSKKINEVIRDFPGIDFDDAVNLLEFLNRENILIEVDKCYELDDFELNPRLFFQMEEYFTKTSETIESINDIKNKTVLIIGLGAVGTWVATSLALSGVKNFILVDGDVVDETNLHRQDGFYEGDIGDFKAECVKRRINEISDSDIKVIIDSLNEKFFKRNDVFFDLAINCADFPSVDVTSEILGKECMMRKVPHLIGGGYNLHLTLIGQAVIPGETACVNCFKEEMKYFNYNELDGVEKLFRPSRKIGSFGPLCSLSASITAGEAIKILAGRYSDLATANKRIEFRLSEMDFFVSEVSKQENCNWCGVNGIYSS